MAVASDFVLCSCVIFFMFLWLRPRVNIIMAEWLTLLGIFVYHSYIVINV